jgi:hypothetical protein
VNSSKNLRAITRLTMKTIHKTAPFFIPFSGTILKTAFLLFIFFTLKINSVEAQGYLTGFVVDDEFNEPLEKAVVTIPGTLISVLTDQQGKYVLKMMAGDYFMKVDYPGYFGKQYNMSVSDGITTPMFIIKLTANAVGQTMQRRITSLENKLIFPQSITNFSTWQVAEQNGNQEFNSILKTIPSVSFHSNGNGFGDSEAGFRGNDLLRTSYTFNGILLNNPETGRIAPSQLSGLTDRAGQIQVSFGQSANLQATTSYGGLVNVLSYLPKEKAGTDVLAIYGNNGFLKTSATVHSGLSKKKFASSFQISRTSGDGTAQNTGFEQYSLFMDLRKELNQFHTFVFNASAVIQEHDRNFSDSIGAYNLYGTKYNRNWGYLSKKPLSVSTNFERNPLISLTHFWQPRIKTSITTQIFAQFNRSAKLMPGGSSVNEMPRDTSGQIEFDQIIDWNKGLNVSEPGTIRPPDSNGKFINSETAGISTLVAIDSENRLGLRSVFTHQFSKKLDLSGSFNLDQYHANHFGAVHDLLGADGFTSHADLNQPDGFAVQHLFQSSFLPGYKSADKVAYNYESSIQTGGLSFRINYQSGRYFWYFGGSGSMQNIQRTDHFNYLATDAARKTDAVLLPGGHLQTGLRIRFWKYHSVYARTSYGSYQPFFTTLFPSGNNWKNAGAKNEQVFDAEMGYTIFSRKLKMEALAYRTQITNRPMVRYYNLPAGDSFGLVNGLAEIHQGVELKTSYKIGRNIQLQVNGSLGDWKYAKDSEAQLYNSENQLSSTNALWIKNVRIANAPQFAIYSELEYRWAHNFYVRINYYRAERIFSPFGLYDFNNLTSRTDFVQWQLPKYDLIGFSGNYLLKIGKTQTLNLIFGGQNLLDTEYIEQSATNMNEENPGYTDNQVYYGMGRTWFAGIKFQF